MQRLIECVPNFSEGRDAQVISEITAVVETVPGVRLLDVDPGAATNRTVVTFVGEPEPVIEAAVLLARKCAELVDMTQQTGEHPRFGALDVCPLVPVSGVTMDETVAYARILAKRLGEEVGLSIYCYEKAALRPQRSNLAIVRAGEYEALKKRLADPEWAPDFGPSEFQPRTGATAVGARDFLVAYNVNLNSTSTRRANAIAFDVREKGRIKRTGNPLTGEVVRDDAGDAVWLPGALKCVKGIGWFIEEYGVAQISMNLTDISVTPIHVAFDEVCDRAGARGIRVTGSEMVGMVPLRAMLDAGRYFLRKQKRSTGVSDRELIKIAVKSLGLDELVPFDPAKTIIEYAVADSATKRLVDMSVREFTEETASESPAPGGGSIAAALGAFGAALSTMVANLSSHRRGWDERWEEFSDWAEKGKACQDELLLLVDKDTDAFNQVMAGFGLPKGTDEEKAARTATIQAATLEAARVPLEVMNVAVRSMDVAEAMAKTGLSASLSDAGVAALCARSAVMGAALNVRINAKDLKDTQVATDLVADAERLVAEAQEKETAILAIVDAKLAE